MAQFSCRGLLFEFHLYSTTNAAPEQLATVLVGEEPLIVQLHSASPLPLLQTDLSFLAILSSWENQSLWDNLVVDGDMRWLSNALVAGSLRILHDGSYMKKVTPKVCSTALLITCSLTNQHLTCT